ncbi:MAG: hypothetical protein RL519_1424 [Pseudomonadota bacterium]
MAAAIGGRSDYTSVDLRRFARRSGDPDQVRRLLAVALILDGGSRSEAAKVAGVTLQIVRDWVLRFNEGGPDGLATHRAPGRAAILNDEQRARLAEIVEAGRITNGQVVDVTGANRNTVKKHLQMLVSASHLVWHGSGKATWYSRV